MVRRDPRSPRCRRGRHRRLVAAWIGGLSWSLPIGACHPVLAVKAADGFVVPETRGDSGQRMEKQRLVIHLGRPSVYAAGRRLTAARDRNHKVVRHRSSATCLQGVHVRRLLWPASEQPRPMHPTLATVDGTCLVGMPVAIRHLALSIPRVRTAPDLSLATLTLASRRP